MPIPSPDDDTNDAKSENHDRAFTTEQLDKIYPVAKTYEDRRKDRQDREARWLRRQPNHITAYVAVRLFILATLVALLFKLVPALVAWNVISGAFNIVLCVLVIIAITKWQGGQMSLALSQKDLNETVFFTIYVIIPAPLMILALSRANSQESLMVVLSFYVLLFLVHFLCIYGLIRLLSRTR